MLNPLRILHEELLDEVLGVSGYVVELGVVECIVATDNVGEGFTLVVTHKRRETGKPVKCIKKNTNMLPDLWGVCALRYPERHIVRVV